MKILAINYPMAIIDNGDRIPVERIKGSPRIGCTIDYDGEGYKVTGNNVDPDCVGSQCPIK